jgi:demethylmenaquinone methyltransferase/2-methoxy-6-polyprenyl-1,4-benzoquinol methylase
MRNAADLELAFKELRRVLRPEGRLACLEITRAQGRLAPFFDLWFDRMVPQLGKLLPGGRAYTYLPASVRRFPGPADLAAVCARAGFSEIRWRMLGGGIVALHTARVE